MVAVAGRGFTTALVVLLIGCSAPVAWGAENGRIYYPVRPDGQTQLLYSANGDGTCGSQLTTGEDLYDLSPSSSSAGTPVYFVHRTHNGNRVKDSQVYRMDPDGSGKRQVTDFLQPPVQANANPTRFVLDVDVSPNGSRLVLTRIDDDYRGRIYAADADGSGLTQLTNPVGSEYDGFATWSPDGASILFMRGTSSGSGVWQMNADGSGQHQIAAASAPSLYGGFDGAPPRLSPDGTQIVVPKGQGDQTGAAVMNADGSGEPVFNAGARLIPGSWSPDGNRILASMYSGAWSAVTIKRDGTDRQAIPGLPMGGFWAPKVAGASTSCNSQGGAAADVLNGTSKNDRLKGGAGNDTLNGGAGNDT